MPDLIQTIGEVRVRRGGEWRDRRVLVWVKKERVQVVGAEGEKMHTGYWGEEDCEEAEEDVAAAHPFYLVRITGGRGVLEGGVRHFVNCDFDLSCHR